MATKTDTDKVVEQLGGMTVLFVELKNKLEEEGRHRRGPDGGRRTGGRGRRRRRCRGGEDRVRRRPHGAGGQKIQVIKVVRAVTGLGLKEASWTWSTVRRIRSRRVPQEEADSIKAQLEEAGAAVEVK